MAALFWPGVPMFDTIDQYGQVLGGDVDDWHPPVMVRLWQMLHAFGSGTAPMFAVQVGLYAVGFALLVVALVRTGRWRAAIAVAALALSPLLLGWQMVVLKDAQMVGALAAAIGIVGGYRLRARPVPAPMWTVVVVLFTYATLVRANAAFATVPLVLLLLPLRARPLLLAVFALAGVAAILVVSPLINHHLLGAAKGDVAKSEPVFDLAGIAVRTPPASASVFTAAERAQITSRHCVKAFFWDPLGDPGYCGEATQRVTKLPSGRLYRELASAAATHLPAYAAHRLAHWNSTERWLVPNGLPEADPADEAEPNDLGLVGPTSPAASAWQDAAAAEAATPLGWPIVWTVIAGLLGPLAWRRRADPAGGLALALLGSALAYEASFLIVSIASDLRYHLWPMTASALALILLSDRSQLTRHERAAGGALLVLVVGGGLFARALLPAAPETYEAMINTVG